MTPEEKYQAAIDALRKIASYETSSTGYRLRAGLDAPSTMAVDAKEALEALGEPS